MTSTECPYKGDLVELTLEVPQSRKAAACSPLTMRMSGEVVRVIINSSGKVVCGFALERRNKPSKNAKRDMNAVPEPGHSESMRWN